MLRWLNLGFLTGETPNKKKSPKIWQIKPFGV